MVDFVLGISLHMVVEVEFPMRGGILIHNSGYTWLLGNFQAEIFFKKSLVIEGWMI